MFGKQDNKIGLNIDFLFFLFNVNLYFHIYIVFVVCMHTMVAVFQECRYRM